MLLDLPRPSEMFGTFQRLDQTLIIKLGFIKPAPLPLQGTTSQEFHFTGLLCNLCLPVVHAEQSVCQVALPNCADTRGSEVLTLCQAFPRRNESNVRGRGCCPATHPVRLLGNFLFVGDSAEKWETIPHRRRGVGAGERGVLRKGGDGSRQISVFDSF